MAYENSVYEYNENGELCVRVTGVSGGGGDQHNLGWYATQSALETAHPTATDGDWAIVGSTDTVWVWDSDNDEWKDTDQKGQVESVNGKTGVVVLNAEDVGAIPQYADMPEPNQAGEIAQYIGEYGGTYKTGYFYKSVEVPGDVVSGEIDVNYWYPDQFTPPVTGSVDVDVFSQYLEQNNLAPISDGKIEITFQPGSNNIIFAYNVDTNWTRVDIPWTTVTTQAAEALFLPLGFDFDFSGIPTDRETATGGQMPSATKYVWENTSVQDGVEFYGYDPENFTFDDLGKIYCRSEFNENAVGFYKVVNPAVDSYVGGYAKVNSFNWNTNPTDFPKVNIDSTILEDYFTTDNTPLDYNSSIIEITVEDVEIEPGVNGYEIKIKHNLNEDESTITVSTHTLEGIIQALENIGIYIDINEVPSGIQYLNMNIPSTGIFISDPIPVRYVLPEQFGNDGKFLTTDGTNASWGNVLVNADSIASTTGLADGNYRLRLTMTNGVPSLSWVAE